MSKQYYVYMLANGKHGPIYTGVTSSLIARVYIHRNELLSGHTSRYHIHHLVYFEAFDQVEQAILREKRIKKWRRAWKNALVEESNPDWRDLYPDIAGS